MEKKQLIKKVRELAESKDMYSDNVVINQAEIAVIMQTFGIYWTELKQPFVTFTSYYERKRTDSDLKQEFNWFLKTLKLARHKKMRSSEREVLLMLKGFIKGVKFFDQKLGEEFSIMADKSYYAMA